MKRDILLISASYPYPGGETFLKNEIDSGIFQDDHVIFCPILATGSYPGAPRRDVLAFHRRQGPALLVGMLYGLIRTVCSRAFYAETAYLFRSGRMRPDRFASLIRFSAQAEFEYSCIFRQLKKSGLTPGDPVTFYAYWLHRHAYIAARLKRKYPNSVAVARGHRYDLYEYRSNGYIPYRAFILSNLDRVFPISKDGEEYIRSQYGQWVGDKMTLSYLGTDDHGIGMPSDDGRLHVVSCSNVIPVKRVGLIVDALSKITDIEIDWTHYGDGELRASVEKKAAESLGSNIHWHFAGMVDNAALMELYQKAKMDLFINVSESEGLPVSIMEIMSFGVPVIATDVGGTGEIVSDGENGFLLPMDFDPKALADLIARFAKMPQEERGVYRAKARATWSERFDAQKNYREFYRQLEELWER